MRSSRTTGTRASSSERAIRRFRMSFEAALDGMVSPDHIFGTELEFGPDGEAGAIVRVPAGYGKVAVIEELEGQLDIALGNTIYVGDGRSDVHVMLHVNNREGHTIAVSESKQLARIAKSTVLSEDAFSVVVPILEQVLGWRSTAIYALFESSGLRLHEWEKARTHRVTVSDASGGVVA